MCALLKEPFRGAAAEGFGIVAGSVERDRDLLAAVGIKDRGVKSELRSIPARFSCDVARPGRHGERAASLERGQGRAFSGRRASRGWIIER